MAKKEDYDILKEMSQQNSLGNSLDLLKEKNNSHWKQILESIIDERIEKKVGIINDAPGKQEVNLNKDNLDLSKKCKTENNLKEIIKKSPYIQEEVARMIGISSKTLSNILSNKFSTSLDVALKISYLFNIPVNDIFNLVESNEEE